MSKSKKGNKKGGKKKSTGYENLTVDQLIEQAGVALGNYDLKLADTLYSTARVKEPLNTQLLDALADVNMQMGEMEIALGYLVQSTQEAPEENPYKWMFKGQLEMGTEAVSSYREGIRIMTANLENEALQASHDVLRKQIAKAHCSIAEIYLTDLCFEDCAEETCEREVQLALTTDPSSLDGLQTKASIRLSQKRGTEAADLLDTVYERIMRIREVIKARTVVEEISGAEEPAEFSENPELEFCIATAKLLVECSVERPTHASKAIELLADLLNEDDENIELWYLMGVASMSCSPPDLDNARYNLERAQEMLERVIEDCENNGEEFPFEEQYVLVKDHLKLLTESEGDGPVAVSENVEGEAGQDDEEWSDCDEDDEMEQS